MYELYDNFARIMRDMAHAEALSKIARRAAQKAAIGRSLAEIAQAHQNATRHRCNMQRLQINNNRLTELRRHHRTKTR